MTPPTIQSLGIMQDWSSTRWQAIGHVEGLGWLEAWGPSLVAAMEALQAIAVQRVAEAAEMGVEDQDKAP